MRGQIGNAARDAMLAGRAACDVIRGRPMIMRLDCAMNAATLMHKKPREKNELGRRG
jgi:hypothetical protein